MILDYDYFTSD